MPEPGVRGVAGNMSERRAQPTYRGARGKSR